MQSRKLIAYYILFTILLLCSCSKPSTIEVQNNLPQTTLKKIYWGDIYIAYEVLPTETTGQVKLFEDAQYQLDFPEEYPLKFLLVQNDQELLVQTETVFELRKEQNLYIEITDSTKVIHIK